MDKHMEILHGIVSAEQDARASFDEAVKKQVSFETDLASHISTLREQYYASADKEIALYEESEKAKADAEISVLVGRYQRELEAADAAFSQKKEGYAQKLFEIVVNQNA